jgi:hypothetical protein
VLGCTDEPRVNPAMTEAAAAAATVIPSAHRANPKKTACGGVQPTGAAEAANKSHAPMTFHQFGTATRGFTTQSPRLGNPEFGASAPYEVGEYRDTKACDARRQGGFASPVAHRVRLQPGEGRQSW